MFGRQDDSRDHDRDRDSDADADYGSGSDRDDSPFASRREESFMPMTRRDSPSHADARSPAVEDVDRLYSHALRDTGSFLKDRDKHVKARTTGEQVLSVGEMVVGALLGGYLSQRFRATSGAVPTGLLLGGIGFGAAQFTQMFGKHSEDVKNLAIGSALASAVIWAAGYGAVSAEKAQAKTEGNFPATGAEPQQLQQQWPTPAYQPAFAQQPPTPSVADFQNLVTRGE